jgi:hypothetical protein
MDVKEKIIVFGFPVDNFDRKDLDKMTDGQLYALAQENKSVLRWRGLELFQEALNNDSVDTENRWLYFVDMTNL